MSKYNLDCFTFYIKNKLFFQIVFILFLLRNKLLARDSKKEIIAISQADSSIL